MLGPFARNIVHGMIFPEPPITIDETAHLIECSLPTSPVHPIARCRWCNSEFVFVHARKPSKSDLVVQVPGHWLCRSPECAQRQLRWAMADERETRAEDASPWIYVPTPACAEMHEVANKNVFLGGAAGGSKSHGLRWHAYWWCQRIPGYKVLLLRETFPELENSHLLKMDTIDQHLLARAKYNKGEKAMIWPDGAMVKAGHVHKSSDMKIYLSQEWDEIVIDEAGNMARKTLVNVTSRARSDQMRPEVRERGGGWVRLASNPGGPGALYLQDFYITRDPDPRKHKKYHPEHFSFISAKVEDNPYLEEDYVETRLDPLDPERYEQLRNGVWGSFDGQFFSNFNEADHVLPAGAR